MYVCHSDIMNKQETHVWKEFLKVFDQNMIQHKHIGVKDPFKMNDTIYICMFASLICYSNVFNPITVRMTIVNIGKVNGINKQLCIFHCNQTFQLRLIYNDVDSTSTGQSYGMQFHEDLNRVIQKVWTPICNDYRIVCILIGRVNVCYVTNHST